MEHLQIINRGRGPELAGTRITVFDVLHYHDAGWQSSSIALELDISSAQVDALLAHFTQHETEIRAEQQRIQDRIDRGNSPEIQQRQAASRTKLLRFRQELRAHRPEDVNGARHIG